MPHALVFVLAPEGSLPGDGVAWAELLAAQRQGVGSGLALRMFRVPPEHAPSLDDLVGSGQANASGADPFEPLRSDPCEADPSPPASDKPSPRRLICDAVVPQFDPRSLWLGAYQLSGPEQGEASGHPARRLRIDRISALDQFPLREADNETCWFYPTENGEYLCWENRRRIELLPGYPTERSVQEDPIAYQRSDIRLLWSLMADDQALTCVGLTYQRRRIEWPIAASDPEPFATWTAFRVDSMADDTYREHTSITVFPRREG
jgi:hypothetical protein